MLGPQKRKPFNSGQIFIGIWTIFIILHLDLSQVEYMNKIFEVRVGAMKICNSVSLPTLHALHRNMAPCWPSGEIRKTRLTSHIYVMSLAIARCFTNFLSTERSPIYYTGSFDLKFLWTVSKLYKFAISPHCVYDFVGNTPIFNLFAWACS